MGPHNGGGRGMFPGQTVSVGRLDDSPGPESGISINKEKVGQNRENRTNTERESERKKDGRNNLSFFVC